MKNDMRNWLILTQAWVNFNDWAKKIQSSCAVKNDLWFQKWHKEFGEFSHN